MPPPVVDTDGDGVVDTADNGPEIQGSDQTKNDEDGAGAACDPDDGLSAGEAASVGPW